VPKAPQPVSSQVLRQEEEAQAGRQEQERSQRHLDRQVHPRTQQGRPAARADQQEGVWHLQRAPGGLAVGARAGDAAGALGPDTTKTIQIILDGEVCLEQQMRELFPKAILTLDIRHAQERLWQVGRQLHAEGSEELTAWVEPLAELLYQGKVGDLLERLEGLRFVGPGSKQKRKISSQATNYLRKREGLMRYEQWREEDLVLASGVVEGAARYVIGERLDNSGMRWIVERAEAVLLLRCIEVNGDWDDFFAFAEEQRRAELSRGEVVRIGSQTPTQVPQISEEAEQARHRRKAKAVA
jgi:hypothetical protein